ncbi:MAG: hypothetical protein JNK12_05310 [Acidimicrobiales bacterium]|nr:hypothetical protein [Acidimicrobiales bacterium]
MQLTDLHLFVDHRGATKPPQEQRTATRRATRLAGPLANELAHAGPRDVGNLLRLVPQAVESEVQWIDGAGPVIVVQTGDVEAYGQLGTEPFQGFDFLQETLYPRLRDAGVAHIIDLFGNHDVWPGTWPLFRPIGQMGAVRRLADDGHMPPPLPRLVEISDDLSFVLVNTVWAAGLMGALRGGVCGSGRVTGHLPGAELPLSAATDPLGEIRAIGAPQAGALRVALMHHPPHMFDNHILQALTTCALDDADELCAALNDIKVSLVLAGHRHRIFPPPDSSVDGRDDRHLPLWPGSIQITSGSPTVGDPSHRGISILRLQRDEAEDVVHIERRIVASGANDRNRVDPFLVRNLPLP